MTNEQLVLRIQAGENVGENMAALYNQMQGFIDALAARFHGSGLVDDLKQEGFLALYDAIDTFDQAYGVQFVTHAAYWIKQRMKRYVQRNSPLVRLSFGLSEKVRRYERFCSSFRLEYGREPSAREIAAFLGVTLEEVREITKSALAGRVASLDAPIKGSEEGSENGGTYGDFIASGENLEDEVLDRMEHEELCGILHDCVGGLPGDQADVVRRRYQGGQTFREVAAARGCTYNQARQLDSKAMRALRRSEVCDRLRPFLPEAERAWMYSEGLKGNGVERYRQTLTSSTERVALRL